MTDQQPSQPPNQPSSEPLNRTHDTARAAQENFVPGDLVILRSGGPVMTVERTNGSQVNCIWFSADETLRSTTLPAAALESANDAELGLADQDGFFEFEEEHEEHEEIDMPEKKKKKKK
ncbi:MAG: YodC family protein [Beijerinckiaceae bacterium]